MQIDLATLPDDPATLQQMLREVVTAVRQQQTTLQQRDAEIDKLHLLIKRLLRYQFGRRSTNASGARHAPTATTAPSHRICRAMRC